VKVSSASTSFFTITVSGSVGSGCSVGVVDAFKVVGVSRAAGVVGVVFAVSRAPLNCVSSRLHWPAEIRQPWPRPSSVSPEADLIDHSYSRHGGRPVRSSVDMIRMKPVAPVRGFRHDCDAPVRAVSSRCWTKSFIELTSLDSTPARARCDRWAVARKATNARSFVKILIVLNLRMFSLGISKRRSCSLFHSAGRSTIIP